MNSLQIIIWLRPRRSAELKKTVISILLLINLIFPVSGEIIFSSAELNADIINSPIPLMFPVSIENSGDEEVNVKIMPTCDCTSVDPGEITLGPRSRGEVVFKYDPKEVIGFLINRTDRI